MMSLAMTSGQFATYSFRSLWGVLEESNLMSGRRMSRCSMDERTIPMTLNFMKFTFPEPCTVSELPNLYNLVMEALWATHRLPVAATMPEPMLEIALPESFRPDNIESLVLERIGDGWAACIGFADIPADEPDAIGIGHTAPYASALEAFLGGASALCALVTGSPELPFLVSGNSFVVMAYGASPSKGADGYT